MHPKKDEQFKKYFKAGFCVLIMISMDYFEKVFTSIFKIRNRLFAWLKNK